MGRVGRCKDENEAGDARCDVIKFGLFGCRLGQEQKLLDVSLCQLLENAGKFDGKLLPLRDTFVLDAASQEVRLSYDGSTRIPSIRLQLPKELKEERETLDRADVRLVGVFRQPAKGDGLLADISGWKILSRPSGRPLAGNGDSR